MPIDRAQYILIEKDSRGVRIYPSGPDTKTAENPNAGAFLGSFIDAINKMTEYGYRLLQPGTIVGDRNLVEMHIAVFMERN
jgi:hypothetical protein